MKFLILVIFFLQYVISKEDIHFEKMKSYDECRLTWGSNVFFYKGKRNFEFFIKPESDIKLIYNIVFKNNTFNYDEKKICDDNMDVCEFTIDKKLYGLSYSSLLRTPIICSNIIKFNYNLIIYPIIISLLFFTTLSSIIMIILYIMKYKKKKQSIMKDDVELDNF